jgi:hypothetical protein
MSSGRVACHPIEDTVTCCQAATGVQHYAAMGNYRGDVGYFPSERGRATQNRIASLF